MRHIIALSRGKDSPAMALRIQELEPSDLHDGWGGLQLQVVRLS